MEAKRPHGRHHLLERPGLRVGTNPRGISEQHDNQNSHTIANSPARLTPIYDGEKRKTLKQLVFEEVNKCNNLNLFVTRRKDYVANGRVHTKSQADRIDGTVRKFLLKNHIPFLGVEGSPEGVKYAKDLVLATLKLL